MGYIVSGEKPFSILDGYMSFGELQSIASYGGTTNLVYYGYARFGTKIYEPGWVILKQTFDSGGNFVRGRAVLAGEKKPKFKNVWQSLTAFKQITSITKASPAVITTKTAHGWTNANRIEIIGCDADEANGNGFGSVMFKLRVLTPTTAVLVDVDTDDDIDSSAWVAVGTKGSAFLREYANYIVS